MPGDQIGTRESDFRMPTIREFSVSRKVPVFSRRIIMRKAYFSVSLFGLVLFITSFLSFSPSPIVAQVKVTPRIVARGATTIPVYRFYYHSKFLDGFHLYRTVPDVPGAGWQAEGIVFYVSPVQLPYTVPLYVVYKTGDGAGMDHFYTVDVAVRDNCVKNLGYQDQGVFGYVLPKGKDYPGTTSLYRWVRVWILKEFAADSSVFQDHFYQVSSSPVANYSSEGIECNVWTQAINLPHKLFELSAPAVGATLHVNDNPVLGWKIWSGEGFVRLSYSVNNGGSWHPIGTVPITGNFGDITEQSYNNWKVPAEAVGKILIKADWVKASSGPELPWASDTRGPLTVLPAALRVLRRP